MKKTVYIVVLLILQALLLDTAHSGGPGGSSLNEELSKQNSIYHSKGEWVPEGYTIDRSLADYTEMLPPGFDRTLADLGPKDRWLDIGAGEGRAILDYYTPDYDLTHPEEQVRRGKKAQAIALSIEDRRTLLWQQKAASLGANQIQYFFGRRLRHYLREELGQFQLITDLMGGFSYTDNLFLFMSNVLGFLELKGSFYTLLQDVHSEKGTNRPFYVGSPFLTEIANADGSEVKVCSWLKSITCVEVTCELRAGWKPPIEVYHVRKVCNSVAVPELVPINYESGTPPQRKFQVKN